MATLQEIKARIKTINTTVKTTKVMQMVATSKLKKARLKLTAAQHYLGHAKMFLQDAITIKLNHDPYFVFNLSALITNIVFTSNKGLCGKLNSSLIKSYNSNASGKSNIEIIGIGNKFAQLLKNRRIQTYNQKITLLPLNIEHSSANEMKIAFLEIFGRAITIETGDAIIHYNHFENFFTQTTKSVSFANEVEECFNSARKNTSPALHDETIDDILNLALQSFFEPLCYMAASHNLASEYAIRTISMDNATRNGQQMAENLLLVFNKTRQAYITKDLIDIISSSNAVAQ